MHCKCPRWSASCARTRPAHPASRYKLLQTATQPRRRPIRLRGLKLRGVGAPIHRTPLANSLSWMKRQPARSAAPRSSLAPEMPRMLPTIT